MIKLNFLFPIFYLLLYSSIASAQATDYATMVGRPVAIATVSRLQEPYYFVYDSLYKAAAFYRSEFKRSTPEELLTSLFSSPNKITYNNNFITTPSTEIDGQLLKRRSQSDTVGNYFLPIHKLTYLEADKEHVIVKYWEMIAGKKDKLYSIHAVRKNGSVWQIQSINGKEDLDYLVRVIKPAAFRALKTSTIPKDEFLKDLHQRTRADLGVLNISKLTSLIKEWEEKNFTDRLSTITDL